jgi:hypothetical protein
MSKVEQRGHGLPADRAQPRVAEVDVIPAMGYA